MQRISNKRMQAMIKKFIKNGIPFYFSVTNQRQVLNSEVGDYMNEESSFPSSELNFIKQVKKHIIKNEMYLTIPNKFKKPGSKSKIKYFSYNRKYQSGSVVNDVVEIDLKSAYWETLNKIPGMLTPELYEKGKQVSKKSRLAAVGSLAKRVEKYHFDGKNEVPMEPETSPLTEFIWDTVCHKVGRLMSKVARECGSDFIFFWVDALFVRKRSLEKVKQMFKDAGFEFSVERCKYIQFNDRDLIVNGKGKWMEVGGEKVFVTTRPFPYKKAMSEAEMINLSQSQ